MPFFGYSGERLLAALGRALSEKEGTRVTHSLPQELMLVLAMEVQFCHLQVWKPRFREGQMFGAQLTPNFQL